MAERFRDLRNLQLYELIGGPLIALVQAEAQAAQATVDFVQQVGFDPPAEGDEGSVGALRMARLSYRKEGADGAPQSFTVEVPVLALVPIPGVRIGSARINFTARITDAQEQPTKTVSSRETRNWIGPKLLQLRGGIAPAKTRTREPDDGARGAFEIDIAVDLEPLPITVGLEKVLTLMDQAIHEEAEE